MVSSSPLLDIAQGEKKDSLPLLLAGMVAALQIVKFAIRFATVIHEPKWRNGLQMEPVSDFKAIFRAVVRIVNDFTGDFTDQRAIRIT